MQEQITMLCRKLVRSEGPEERRPVANQLQNAIGKRVARIQENAIGVAIIDLVVDLDGLTGAHARATTESARRSAG